MPLYKLIGGTGRENISIEAVSLREAEASGRKILGKSFIRAVASIGAASVKESKGSTSATIDIRERAVGSVGKGRKAEPTQEQLAESFRRLYISQGMAEPTAKLAAEAAARGKVEGGLRW